MSEDNNITLSFNNNEIEIKTPETFEELEKIFLKEFKEDKEKHFRFFYIDEEDGVKKEEEHLNNETQSF